LPVDDEINLDNPEGLTQQDIDRMVEQADELERIAYNSEKNAEVIKKNLRVFEGKSFKEINAMRGESVELGESTDEVKLMIADILDELLKAKEEREQNKENIEDNKEEIEGIKEEVKDMESQFRDVSGEAMNVYGQVKSFKGNPLQFGIGKVRGFLRGAGLYGAVAMFAWDMAESIYNEVLKTVKSLYGKGGVFDIRKTVEDVVTEYNSIDYLTKIKSGQVFFTADAGQELVQGAVRGAYNTRELRDGHLRYFQLKRGS